MTAIAAPASASSTALEGIRRDMDTSGVFNVVTHSEIKSVTDGLSRLSPQNANEVVGKLSDAEMRNIANEVSGMSADERRDFFNDMAGKLDGAQLSRLSQAFDSTQPNSASDIGKSDSLTNMGEIAKAVSQHSPEKTKLEFIQKLAPQSNDQKKGVVLPGFGAVRHVQQDPQARAIAEVLGSMDSKRHPEIARKAIDSLSPEQLKAVTHAASQQESMSTGASQPGFYSDTRPLERMLDMAANIPNNATKAKLFKATTGVMTEVNAPLGQSKASEPIRQGLSKLLLSDTNGMTRELRNMDSSGKALATYMQESIKNKDFDTIGKLQGQLMLGNDGKGNHAQRFNGLQKAENGQMEHVNAQNAGYFAGAVGGAVQKVAKSEQEQAELVTAVLKSTMTVIDKAGVGGKLVGGALSVGKEWVSMAVKSAYENSNGKIEERMLTAMMPMEQDKDGRTIRKDHEGATNAFAANWSLTRTTAAGQGD